MKSHRFAKQDESGSSLLVSLMVIAGLSLLGLGFVAITETESAISVNERNYTQTLQVAEAGARTVAEWFNAPEWALANRIMPDLNTYGNTIKQQRENLSYTGFYKPNNAVELLCNIPFSQDQDRFYGVDANSADVVINETNAAAFLTTFNSHLFNDTLQGGRVVEIRIYGPPVVAGTFNTTAGGLRFWNRNVGTRYGLATIAVTAEKTRDGSTTAPVIARRTVRIVVAELPLPGAEGPLQSGSGTGTTGNFRVHWGKAISNVDMAVKRLHTSLPWHDAWTRIRFEEGYAPSYATAAPDYLFELINKGFEDPWFEVRARQNSAPPAGSPITSGTEQLWLYNTPNNVENAVGTSGYSGHFQQQNQDAAPLRRNVLFTRPVYPIWKQIALAGAGQQGIYYLRYVSGTGHDSIWRDTRGVSKTFSQWVNVRAGGFEGFFFFDTTDGSDPQLPNGATNTTVLTPSMSLSSSAGNPFKMRGFFFMNMVAWGSSGLQDPGGYYNYPGEPFQDIGVHYANVPNGQLLCTEVANPIPVVCATNPGSTPWLRNFTNRQWDYQDVNQNGRFDVVVAQNPALIDTPGTDSPDIAANAEYFIVPYSDACGAANGVGTTCSDPHEPYLNLIYPAGFALGGGSDPNPVVVRWEAQALASQTRRPKNFTTPTSGVPVTCTSTSSLADCTSNTYDREGPLVVLGSSAGDGPVVEGIIYNEGNYDASGQAIYYGAVLIQGTVQGAGTPFVFFDESLARGDWAEKFTNLPRTIMTTIETDQ